MEPMNGDVSSASTHSSTYSHPFSSTPSTTTTTSTTPTHNGAAVIADAVHADTYTRLVLVVDHHAKSFPKAISQQLPQLALGQGGDVTPPKPVHSRPPTPPSTATPITQAAHLLLCDEEVPMESVGGEREGEGGGGVCPANLEKMVLGVLSNTLKSIVSAVAD